MCKAVAIVFIYDISAGKPLKQCAYEYAAHIGIKNANFDSIQRSSHGKPYFPDAAEIEFSISHSEKLWVCGFSNTSIGIDIQWHKNCNRSAIAKRFFNPLEYEYLAKSDFKDFFNVWTAKESFVKYTGRGISDEFSEFSVTDSKSILTCIEDANLNHFQIKLDYTLCVCTKSDNSIIIVDRS